MAVRYPQVNIYPGRCQWCLHPALAYAADGQELRVMINRKHVGQTILHLISSRFFPFFICFRVFDVQSHFFLPPDALLHAFHSITRLSSLLP